jgi:ATP-dependent RNA helicase DeaD
MQIQNFTDFPLNHDILQGIRELGFDTPFPIQAHAILPLLEGKDVIGQARTGTGKTAAFGIPMLQRLNPKRRVVQGLILEPTRELAIQTADHLKHLGKHTSLKITSIYGGVSIQRQIDVLRRGVHIVVGTPGRLIDHLKRRTLHLSSVRIVVLDEADRMLDMGFIDDIDYILTKIPRERQISLFSATIDLPVLAICDKYLRNPQKILLSKDEIALAHLHQYYTIVTPTTKFNILCKILGDHHIQRAILFCRTRKRTDSLARKLKAGGYNAASLHGGFTQRQRESVLRAFRKGGVSLLVATDVAARGLDIRGITHIINYDVPLDSLVYFHRIGRTARMEGEGTAITLVTSGEMLELNRIKALTNTPIEEIPSNYSQKIPIIYRSICSDCGDACDVPFKPDPQKPVYCKKCWNMRKSPIVSLTYNRSINT